MKFLNLKHPGSQSGTSDVSLGAAMGLLMGYKTFVLTLAVRGE